MQITCLFFKSGRGRWVVVDDQVSTFNIQVNKYNSGLDCLPVRGGNDNIPRILWIVHYYVFQNQNSLLIEGMC